MDFWKENLVLMVTLISLFLSGCVWAEGELTLGDYYPNNIIMEITYEPAQIVFYYEGNETGTLYLNETIHFEGNATESAQVFFDAIVDIMKDYEY